MVPGIYLRIIYVKYMEGKDDNSKYKDYYYIEVKQKKYAMKSANITAISI